MTDEAKRRVLEKIVALANSLSPVWNRISKIGWDKAHPIWKRRKTAYNMRIF